MEIGYGLVLVGEVIVMALLLVGFYHEDRFVAFENKICRAYRDGLVSKEQLDACSTCDLNAPIQNGLSAASQEQLKNKTGEEIVEADIARQLRK